MKSLAIASVLFYILAYTGDEAIAACVAVASITCAASLYYLVSQSIYKESLNYLEFFAVSTNLLTTLAFLLSIAQGAGSQWTFTRLLTHPLNPLKVTLSDYILALSFNATLLFGICLVSRASPIAKANQQLNKRLNDALFKIYGSQSTFWKPQIIFSTILAIALAGKISAGLGGNESENTVQGIIARACWYTMMPLIGSSLVSLVKEKELNNNAKRLVFLGYSLFPFLIFTITSGRRSIMGAFLGISFFVIRIWRDRSDEKLRIERLNSAMSAIIGKIFTRKGIFSMLLAPIIIILLRGVIDSYQILRTSGSPLSITSIIFSVQEALANRSIYQDQIENESQAGRLLIAAPLANLLKAYTLKGKNFMFSGLSEWLNPFANAIPGFLHNIIFNQPKEELIFGQDSLTDQLGYKIDFTDFLSATVFSSFGYIGIVLVPLGLAVILLAYSKIILTFPSMSRNLVNKSKLGVLMNIYLFSVIAFIMLGGFTDGGLTSYYRVAIISLLFLGLGNVVAALNPGKKNQFPKNQVSVIKKSPLLRK